MKDKSAIIFGAKDFERYYSGEMSGKEMYALEKAALADPFLQDALEGYAHTENAISDIDSLQEKLNNRLEEKKKVRVISFNRNSFLKVAILIAFLAGSAYILLTQNNKVVQNNNLASTTPAELKEAKADSNITTTENDLAIQQNAEAASAPPPVIELHKKVLESKSAKVDVNAIGNNKTKSAPAEPNDKLEEIAVLSAAPAAPGLNIEKEDVNYLVKGKIVNEQGEPIPFASIITNKEQINTDVAGNYSAYVKDSSFYGNVVATGYRSLQKKLNPNLSQTIVLNSEVAKAEKIAERRESESVKKAGITIRGNASIASDEINNENLLTPVNGWPAYEQYLKDSVSYQHDKRVMVQLSFTVNSSGRPQEVKVADGLCLPCNQEAIRLLTEGPDWKPSPKGKGILKVSF